MVRLTDRPDMTLDVYRGRKTTTTTLTYQISHIACKISKLTYEISKLIDILFIQINIS